MSLKKAEIGTYTFPESGFKIGIKKVSPYLPVEMRRIFPAPVPPMQEVDYGDGDKKLEPNPASMDYQRELAEYNTGMEAKIRRLIIKRGTIFEMTDEMKEELEELRQYWRDDMGQELEEKEDKVAYLTYLAIGSDSDIQELVTAILMRSQPTEAAIKDAVDNFRGKV